MTTVLKGETLEEKRAFLNELGLMDAIHKTTPERLSYGWNAYNRSATNLLTHRRKSCWSLSLMTVPLLKRYCTRSGGVKIQKMTSFTIVFNTIKVITRQEECLI